MDPNAPAVQLPVAIISPSDVSRVRRELEAIDEQLRQATLRAEATPARLPRLSQALHDLADSQKIDLLDAAVRTTLHAELDQLLNDAPVIHISFATNPSPAFMAKVTAWFRATVHPRVLLRVGLQPTIAAGCVIRTTNHQYDLSLRRHLKAKAGLLTEAIRGQPPA